MPFGQIHIWVKVFKNGPSKICGRQPLKKIEVMQTISLQIFQRLSTIVLGLILLNEPFDALYFFRFAAGC